MIIFDASYLIVYLHPSPEPAKDRDNKPVSQFRERVDNLIATLNAADQVIGIPAPALAEILVRAGKGRFKYLSILSDSYRFEILPFGMKAAIEAGELIAQIKSNSQPWATWAKMKFDIQIVSIGKAEEVTAIYSDDKDVEALGKRLNLKVIRICDLGLPPSPDPQRQAEEQARRDTGLLFPEVIEEPNEPSRPAEENSQLQTDTAHPAPVQRSDSGRAQGEAAKEGDGKEEVGVDLSSLPERICDLHREGKLPTPFGTEHILEHLKGEFANTYLHTVLANYCEETGDYVKKGQKAWFRRVSEGRYEIL